MPARSICLLASFVFSIGAIIFMWFLYPKQYDYQAQLDKGMFFYQANMVRPPPTTYPICQAFATDSAIYAATALLSSASHCRYAGLMRYAGSMACRCRPC